MAERPEDRRPPRPIVPDPDASLAGHHRPHPPPRPRLWPLWLLSLVLVVTLAGLASAGWLERQRLEARLARLSGEVSNVHARFDAEQGRGEALAALQARLAELETLEDDLEIRLDDWQAAHLAPLAETRTELEARLATLAEDAEVHATTLDAVRDSLDALEAAGREGRGALAEQLATLDEAARVRERRLDELGERLARHAREAQQRHTAMSRRLDDLEGGIEARDATGDDARQRVASLEDRLAEMQAELRELRQSQLVLSAQLEALRP